MNNLVAVLNCICLLSIPAYSFYQPIQSSILQDEKPKKEILVSISSKFYKNPVQVIEGFFKQANIRNKYIDSSLDKADKKNFSFVDFTVDEAVEYLSSKYNVQFSVETIGKKKIYNVEPKKR